MKKGIIKGVVLAMVFGLTVVLFGTFSNEGNTDLTMEMEQASLPVIQLYEQGQKVNQLYGYTTAMNARYMREDITPLGEDMVLPIEIETYKAKIKGVSYEVRSMDTERLVEDTEVTDLIQDGNLLKASLHIQNLLEEDREYLLIIHLNLDGKQAHYYSRIIKPTECYVQQAVDFAKKFHAQTLEDKETSAELATYLEPDQKRTNTSLQHVDINSSLSQVTWADFGGEVTGDVKVSIKEISPSYDVIVLNYCMTRHKEARAMEYYNVEEYYRIRYTADRTYLLNFERDMEQIFKGEDNHFTENGILMGIRDADVEYAYNESGKILCFVQEGELWTYNQSEGELTRVFSFRGLEGLDDRENNMQHDIRIIQVDESGSVDFVVLGYMNRGNHEGEVGTCIYHYDSVTNTIEEKLFISSEKGYEVMHHSFGEMMYENDHNTFYMMLGDCIYKINLETKKEEVLVEGLKEGMYCISESNQYVAWKKGNDLIVYDLKAEKEKKIEADTNTNIRPLGFLKTDFIYGIAENDNAPMSVLKIIDPTEGAEKVLKTYQKEGYYISSVTVSGNSINMKRVQFNGTAFIEASEDSIKNNEDVSDENENRITNSNQDEKQDQVLFTTKTPIEDLSPKFITTKEVVASDDVSMALEQEAAEELFYVYSKGKVLQITNRLQDAIRLANEEMGVVLDDNQAYIWKRGKKNFQNAIEIEQSSEETSGESIPEALSSLLGKEELRISTSPLLASGQTPYEILSDTMKEGRVLDLTGCDVEEILYYVNLGTPVFAMTGTDTAGLIIGYDALNIYVFNGVDGKTEKMELESAKEYFNAIGNRFIAYLK